MSTVKRGVITLYIDPIAYKDEFGEELTEAALRGIGEDINVDAAPICGYEGWKTEIKEIEVTNGI